MAPEQDMVLNPRTGQLTPVGEAPTEVLAELIDQARRAEAQHAGWRKLAEAEVQQRLKAAGRTKASQGGWSIEINQPRARAWDADDLELVLRELVDAGAIRASEATGLIERTAKVNGTEARNLLGRLDPQGEYAKALAACFQWKDKGAPKVTVTAPEAGA